MRTWTEKQKRLIDFALASLGRRKAKNAVLLLIYASLVYLLASVMLFTQALRRQAAQMLAGAPDITVQRMTAGRHAPAPAGYLDRIGGLRGVRRMEGRLWGYYYDSIAEVNMTVMAAPQGAGTAAAPGLVAMGAALARVREAKTGSPLVLSSYSGKLFPFTVAEILPADSELATGDLLLVCEEDFRTFFEHPAGEYTDLALWVANPQEVRTVAAKVSRRLPDSRVIQKADLLRTYESIFNWREGIVLALLAGAIAAFAIFAMEKASGLSADEKREIGILKAIGWETADVIRMKFREGTLISLTAFLAGYTAAYVHVFRFSSSWFEPVLKGWSTLYPRLQLSPETDGFQIATLFLFTVLPYGAATIAPIWRAAITDPDSVMRS